MSKASITGFQLVIYAILSFCSNFEENSVILVMVLSLYLGENIFFSQTRKFVIKK